VVASPLDPSPEEARELLRRELLRPEYRDRDLVDRLLTWVERRLAGLADAASASPPLSALAAMVVLLVLVLALGWLVSRARRSARVRPPGAAAVLSDEELSAAELRARARTALAAGRHEDAVVDGFRAIALAQAERGELATAPGRTAHEVAEALALRHPGRATQAREAGLWFDLVRYGDRRASAAQAEAVLALDTALAGVDAR